MERYNVHDEYMATSEHGNVVLYADAQATVEALQAQLREGEAAYHKVGKYNDHLEQQVEALQRERDEALRLAYIGEHYFPDCTWKARCEETVTDLRKAQAALDAEREINRGLVALLQQHVGETGMSEGAVDVLRRKLDELTQLQALVRALLETWVNGRKIHDGIPMTLRQQIDSTLDATTPAIYTRIVDDGFGSSMEMCDRKDCGLQVVRPGKFQCTQPDCYDNNKGGNGEL